MEMILDLKLFRQTWYFSCGETMYRHFLNRLKCSCDDTELAAEISELNNSTRDTKTSSTSAEVEAAWALANVQASKVSRRKSVVVKRSFWKTIRIFVSSTFKDFDSEREVLVKKVFPDLRAWCLQRRLHLVECDLRWGIPLSSQTEAPIRVCLGEIDRCYLENIVPFFINMASERIGWIPKSDEIPQPIREAYDWIEGMSITEMEIMHAAYRTDNPNAIFLIRNPSFLDSVPEKYQAHFRDEDPLASFKLEKLKKMLETRFEKNHVVYYDCIYGGIDPVSQWPRLAHLDIFADTVLKFFKNRIASQYPLPEKTEGSAFEESRQLHETFMKLQTEIVVGRNSLFDQLSTDTETNRHLDQRPTFIIGSPGLGKTTVLCALADKYVQMYDNNEKTRVFFHFTGAVADSTNFLQMLNRMLIELKVRLPKVPNDLEEVVGLVRGELSRAKQSKFIVFVDAIDQFADMNDHPVSIAWIPSVLSPNVRLFVSAAYDSWQSQQIQRNFSDTWNFVRLEPLDHTTSETVVSSLLLRYNKVLDKSQLELLLSKSSFFNPLWLSLAVEELRVFGLVRQLTSKIDSLPGGLFELQEEIFKRFERETDASLLITTLSLLECSSNGLLESELVEMLAYPDLLPEKLKNEYQIHSSYSNYRSDRDQIRITANQWADVYRLLRPFLRPYGSSGEGRLGFYHKSLSSSVKKRYLGHEYKTHFCKLIAKFFTESKSATLDRKIVEYPMAAFNSSDKEGLIKFLSDFQIFDAMYDAEYSRNLSFSWSLVSQLEDSTSTFATMEKVYLEAADNFCSGYLVDSIDLKDRLERIARILSQNRCCTAGVKVAEKLIDITIVPASETLSEKLLNHANSLYLKSIIEDEDLRIHDYFLRTRKPGYDPKLILPRLQALADCYQSTISIFRLHSPEDDRLGRCLNGIAFIYSGIANRGGYGDLTSQAAYRNSVQNIEEALRFYSDKSNHSLNYVDCLVTRAICESDYKLQPEYFEKAEKLIIDEFGPFHPLLLRVYFNSGICQQELGNADGASNWFNRWYQLLLDVFGEHHPRTERAAVFIKDSSFRKIADEISELNNQN